MRRFFYGASLLLFSFLLVSSVLGAEPSREILGLRLNMTKEKAHERLKEIGKFARDERKRQEIWEVKENPHFSHVIIGFDAKNTLRYITAVAREDADAKRLRYSDIGNIDAAHQAGDPKINNFNYEWKLASAAEGPETLVVARGRDPEAFTTYSLKRLAEESDASAEKDEEKD